MTFAANFMSDNAAAPCPEVLAAVAAAAPAQNAGYDGDDTPKRIFMSMNVARRNSTPVVPS